MVSLEEIKQIVGDILQLGERIDTFDEFTPLLGSVPEFDSMAVVSVITAIEDNYGIIVEDDEVSAEVFENLGALTRFVDQKAGT